MKMRHVQVVIVGAGPAGLAAAQSAAAAGANVVIVDDNPQPGGQIWRGGLLQSSDAEASALWSDLKALPQVQWFLQSRIVAVLPRAALLLETPQQSVILHYDKLIIATGARERLLPFPGWTLPGVTGVGGLQALVKGGYPIDGKRVVVAGTGPLLLTVAASLREYGAQVVQILEQTSRLRLARFSLHLARSPARRKQMRQLREQLKGVPFAPNSYVLRAGGATRLAAIRASLRGVERTIDCDYLACSYGLVPHNELAAALGCEIFGGAVRVDRHQRSSVESVYCAGGCSSIGGVDLALAEGHIAGAHAAFESAPAARYRSQRRRAAGFAKRVARGFILRDELRTLCAPNTLVCRCEDVAYEALSRHDNWRSAKLHTRCGMGACQGRICGAAANFLFGWDGAGVAARLPISPTRIDSLIGAHRGGN
jgi:NADPH-dependent 2,4-dienoyl-CoA reductase/sulfur reductase-like enzyme